MIKSGQAGNIFPGNTGYLQIGLTTYDVKIVAAKKEEGNINQTNIRLVQYDKRKNEIKKEICGLSKEVASSGNTFLFGEFNVGFGYMEIKLWYVAKESRKSDNSPIMFIVGTLQNEQNNSYKKLDTIYYPKTTRQLFSNLNSFPQPLPYETYKLQLPPLTTRFSSDSSPIFS